MKYNLRYSDALPEWVGGRCEYPWFPLFGTCKVIIKPKYETDKGLLAHELEHVRQYESNLLHSLLYKYSNIYRYECEVKAYIKQAKVYGYSTAFQYDWMVQAIINNYKLNNIDEKHTLFRLIKGV